MKKNIQTRRQFLKTVGTAAVTVSGLSGCAESLQTGSSTKKKPNILLILVDDLGYGDLSYYGAKDLQTHITKAGAVPWHQGLH